jgi:uncharacterized protein (DUF983 family)
MNVVFGIGIAVILFIVVMLGTQVFYKEPSWESYNCTYPATIITTMEVCPDNITVLQCREMVKRGVDINNETQAKFDECNNRFNEAQKIYGKNLFIVNNIIGIILVIVSLFLFSMVNIAAGISFAGLVLIIYGFMRGWQGTGDILKFVVALIVAALFVYFAVFVNKKYSKKKK